MMTQINDLRLPVDNLEVLKKYGGVIVGKYEVEHHDAINRF